MKSKLTVWELFWYYGVNILTLGVPFTFKVVIKKAFSESK